MKLPLRQADRPIYIAAETTKKWEMNFLFLYVYNYTSTGLWTGTAVAQWLRYCATNRKVAGSIPAGVNGNFH